MIDAFPAVQAPDYVPEHGIQPDDIPCSVCGYGIPHVWSATFTEWRWVRGNSPHPGCTASLERREQEKASLSASRTAGVPVALRRVRIDSEAELVRQMPGESEAAFIYRVQAEAGMSALRRGDAPPRVAILRRNQEAVRLISGWKPEQGWLYIEGGTGGGKTLLASALCNQMVQPDLFEWVHYTEEEVIARFGRKHLKLGPNRMRAKVDTRHAGRVVFIDCAEMDARIRQSWEKDRAPLSQLSDRSVDVLILDDFGAIESKGDWLKQMEQMISIRYRDQLTTVFTANVPFSEMTRRVRAYYGSRVASRLLEMVGVHVAIRGPDWREPMELAEEKREKRPEIDRKAAASGDPGLALFGGDR